MSTLQIDLQTAKQLYPTASSAWKATFETTFGKRTFSTNILDRVQSFDDILSIAGKSLSDMISPSDTKDEAAYKVLKLGIAILNEGWVPDYSDSSQDKYEPIFRHKSGFGLSFDGCGSWVTGTYVGPRLVYRSAALLLHGIKIMDKWYNDFYNK